MIHVLSVFVSLFVLLVAAASAFPAPADPLKPLANGTLGLAATPAANFIPIHHGHCGIHIKQTFGDPHGNHTTDADLRSGMFTAYILDAKHHVLGSLPETRFTYDNKPGIDESTVAMSSRLPVMMLITMEGEGKINDHSHKHMFVEFAIGADEWSSNDKKRCKVGRIETIKIWSFFIFANMRRPIAWTREMDCGFAC